MTHRQHSTSQRVTAASIGDVARCFSLVVFLGANLPAQQVADPSVPPGGSTVSSDPVFKIRLVDGTTRSGRIEVFPTPDTVQVSGEADRQIPLRQIVSMTRELVPPPMPVSGSLLLLSNGDRLHGSPGNTEEQAVPVRSPLMGESPLKVPLNRLLGLVLTAGAEATPQKDLARSVLGEKRVGETLWLQNGDRLAGSLLAITSDKVEFQPDTGPISVPRSSVVAIGFDPALAQASQPEGLYLEVTFTDGSRLSLHSGRIERGRFIARTTFDADVNVPLTAVLRVVVRSELVSYLSDREPDGTQFVGYLGEHPGVFRRNATWDGHPLTVGGQEADRGLGTLPRTLLAYRLSPTDQRFQALVAPDDRAGELANVVFRVLVDGQEKWSSPPMGRRSQPIEVNVEVAHGKILILATEFGDRGDVQDSADWIDARLVRDD